MVRTFSRVAPEVIAATVQFEDGTTEVLTATPEHPFHLADEGRYAPLREVKEGARLTTGDGAEAVLAEVERRYGDFKVFNFEVEGQHNYFGSSGVQVHNAEKCPAWGTLSQSGCERVARFIQDQIGGEIMQLGGSMSGNLPLFAGKITWKYHQWVEKGGRIYDQYTGLGGLPKADYAKLWNDDAPCELINMARPVRR